MEEPKFKIKSSNGATVVTNCATGEQKYLIIPKEDKSKSLLQILKKLFGIACFVGISLTSNAQTQKIELENVRIDGNFIYARTDSTSMTINTKSKKSVLFLGSEIVYRDIVKKINTKKKYAKLKCSI